MMTVTSPASRGAAVPQRRWRTVDIVVLAVIAALFGAIFWAWGYLPTSKIVSGFPPLAGLLNTVFIAAGPLGALIVRRPGAALFTELVAAVFEALISTHWSATSILVYGGVQGLAAEVGFAVFAYRLWRLPAALLSGALAGAAMAFLDVWVYHYYDNFSAGYKADYLLACTIGGAVVAGAGAWYLVRLLAATGVLAPFASGRSQRLV
jgi:energy-coupling factor transport system permease protein